MASVERVDGGKPIVLKFEEHGTPGSFSIGDLVALASNGKVQIATAGSAVLGIARRGYTGTENTDIEVELISLDGLYSARYKSSATSQALVGDLVDFTYTAGGHTLDESGASTDAYVVGLDPRDDLGDSSGRLIIRFLPTIVVNNF